MNSPEDRILPPLYLSNISVQATGPGSYVGAFYQSTAPGGCTAALADACSANSTVGNANAPTFVLANNSSTPITSGVLSLVGNDSYQVGTIPANSFQIIQPGLSNDGQSHLAQGGFFATTGTPYASGDLGPNANSTQFTFTGTQNGAVVQSLDVCGSIAAPNFTPACTAGFSNDERVSATNFLGQGHAGCTNCFGPALVARLIGVSSSGGPPPLTITSGAPPASGTLGVPYGPFTATASGGSGSFQWSASGVPGVTIGSATGTLGGTPTTVGVFSLTVTVADASNPSSTVSE